MIFAININALISTGLAILIGGVLGTISKQRKIKKEKIKEKNNNGDIPTDI